MIEIILDKSFIHDYGDIKSKIGLKLEKIFLNEKNTFIINQSLLKYIDENIQDEFIEKWRGIFTHLSDNNQLKSSKNNTLNVDNIFKELPKSSADFIIILENLDDIINSNIRCSLRKETIEHLLFIELLQQNNMIFRSHYFSNDKEIIQIFNKIFTCSKTKHRVIIVSRYANFNCELIKLFKKSFDKKTFWTTYKGINDPSTNFQRLKNLLGNQLMLYTGKNEEIHERKLIIGNVIIEFDDDFNKITNDVDTWVCNCIIDKKISTQLRNKQTKLRRIHN